MAAGFTAVVVPIVFFHMTTRHRKEEPLPNEYNFPFYLLTTTTVLWYDDPPLGKKYMIITKI